MINPFSKVLTLVMCAVLSIALVKAHDTAKKRRQTNPRKTKLKHRQLRNLPRRNRSSERQTKSNGCNSRRVSNTGLFMAIATKPERRVFFNCGSPVAAKFLRIGIQSTKM